MDKKDGAIRVALYRALEKLKKILKGAKYE